MDPKRFRTDERVFPSASEDAQVAARPGASPQTRSPTYRLAFSDTDFLLREELRGVRLQLELLKPELIQQEHDIRSTVVIFGSTRLPDAREAAARLAAAEEAARAEPHDPDRARAVAVARQVLAKSRYYDEAREVARLITDAAQGSDDCDLVVITGGGPGIMEAANRGAGDAGGKSMGLNIVLPMEQAPNPYVTPELSFQFHYFAIRKMHFLMRAKAMIAFPGGFGTLDELFEALTLIQTGKVRPVPILLFGREFWERVVDFDYLVAEGTIAHEDLNLFQYVETAADAWQIIRDFYTHQLSGQDAGGESDPPAG